jgi:hypothetical protein
MTRFEIILLIVGAALVAGMVAVLGWVAQIVR